MPQGLFLNRWGIRAGQDNGAVLPLDKMNHLYYNTSTFKKGEKMKTEVPTKTIHIALTMTINESKSWAWDDPKVEDRMDFDIPVEMFEPKRLVTLVENKISGMLKEFPAALMEYAKAKAKAEAEKLAKEAKAEAEKLAKEAEVPAQ
jgi:hypothetical protein